MADWPLLGDGQRWVASTTTASRGATVTPNATANTKGSFAQLLSAANNVVDGAGLLIHIGQGVNNMDFLADIAIGAAASEIVIAPNLYMGAYGRQQGTYFLPIAIPTGTRISARTQCNATSAGNIHVNCQVIGGGFLPSSPLSRVTAYGADTADSGGVSVDPGGTSNTKGAWSELSASTNSIVQLIVSVGMQMNLVPSSANFMIDVGIGTAGSEVVLMRDLAVTTTLVGYWMPTVFPPLPANIPAGSRLVARASCSISDATDRLIDVFAYGVD